MYPLKPVLVREKLELKLESELDLPLGVRQGLGDLGTTACALAAISRYSRWRRRTAKVDKPRSAAAAARPYVRKVEGGVVEDVKEFSSENQPKSFA